MASLISQATALALRLSGMRRKFASETRLANQFKRGRKGPARPSRSMQRRFDITLKQLNGHAVYIVHHRSASASIRKLIEHGFL